MAAGVVVAPPVVAIDGGSIKKQEEVYEDFQESDRKKKYISNWMAILKAYSEYDKFN